MCNEGFAERAAVTARHASLVGGGSQVRLRIDKVHQLAKTPAVLTFSNPYRLRNLPSAIKATKVRNADAEEFSRLVGVYQPISIHGLGQPIQGVHFCSSPFKDPERRLGEAPGRQPRGPL